MSLRLRLMLYFMVIVIVPLLAIAVYQVTSISSELNQRTAIELENSQAAAATVLRTQANAGGTIATMLAGEPALQQALQQGNRAALHTILARLSPHRDLLAVLGPGNRLLASAGRAPSFLPGVKLAPLSTMLAAPLGSRWSFLLQRQEIAVVPVGCTSTTCALGHVVVAQWMDSRELDLLRAGGGPNLTVIDWGRPVASTISSLTPLPVSATLRSLGEGPATLGGVSVVSSRVALVKDAGVARGALVASLDASRVAGVGPAEARLAVIVALALAAAALLGSALARSVNAPLQDLADQARAIARGRFDGAPSRLEARDEVGQLARAFDTMRQDLRTYVGALEASGAEVQASRDELLRTLAQLGSLLSSTHDLPNLLGLVLQSAVRTLRAQRGSLLLLTPDRQHLRVQAIEGDGLVDLASAHEIAVGEGRVGAVAATGLPMVFPVQGSLGLQGQSSLEDRRAPAARSVDGQLEPSAATKGVIAPQGTGQGVREGSGPAVREEMATEGPREGEVAPGLHTEGHDRPFDDVQPAVPLLRAPGEPEASTQISVPLLFQGKVLGVLSLYDRIGGELFGPEDASALTSLAAQAAVGMENVRLHEEARRLSLTDPMTGTWNYRFFQRRLEEELERARRYQRPLALLVLDIDHFKQINDHFGHRMGDEVLIAVVARLRERIREVDTLSRYGGEEFTVILPETGLAGAMTAAEKLRLAVAREPIRWGAESVSTSVSIGAAAFPDHASCSEDLVRAADAAMYVAKGRGRNRIMAAHGAPPEPAPAGASVHRPVIVLSPQSGSGGQASNAPR